jgi:hypothetical protein
MLTGEAKRQRSIIATLATQDNSADRTRTAISQRVAEEGGIVWKNIYSGIFRDLDEVFIPLGIAKEEGRLPLKRGPKALQEKGIPYYQLTQKGLIISLSLEEISEKKTILKEFFKNCTLEEKKIQDIMMQLIEVAPKFVFSLFEKYVRKYCMDESFKILPLSLETLKQVHDETIQTQRELLEGFSNLTKSEKEKILIFFRDIS